MGGVYVDLRVLEATRRLVSAQPTRNIPADNRILVEQATHPEVLSAMTQELGGAWVRFGIDYEGALAATRTVANLHALPFDKPFDETQFPEDEGRVGSRLGAADRVVVFEPPPQGPFGRAVTELAIRHHMLPRGLAPDALASRVLALSDGAGFSFDLGAATYRYTRLGVERIPSNTTKESPTHAQ